MGTLSKGVYYSYITCTCTVISHMYNTYSVQYIQVYYMYMYNTYTTCAEDCCYCICPFQSGSTDSGNVDSSTSSKLILSHQSTQTVCNR